IIADGCPSWCDGRKRLIHAEWRLPGRGAPAVTSPPDTELSTDWTPGAPAYELSHRGPSGPPAPEARRATGVGWGAWVLASLHSLQECASTDLRAVHPQLPPESWCGPGRMSGATQFGPPGLLTDRLLVLDCAALQRHCRRQAPPPEPPVQAPGSAVPRPPMNRGCSVGTPSVGTTTPPPPPPRSPSRKRSPASPIRSAP